jgi:chromate reductase, NAD(P)H dehydrogenase (quinone)
MATLLGIAGSLRRGSYNAALLRAAAELKPGGTAFDVASLRGIPLYDHDVEEREFPQEVASLKERITRADGLVIVTPEYNHSIPGVLKNTIDWLSRPPKDIKRVFTGKPVFIMGASTGLGGTRFAQAALLPVVAALGMRPWYGKAMYVAQAAQVFDASGELVDKATRERLARIVAEYAAFVDSARRDADRSHAAE